MSQKFITLFTDFEDANVVASFRELLEPAAMQRVATLEAAARTASDLLILYMPKRTMEERIVPGELIDDLKRKKILAIGFAAKRVFRELDLQIGAGHGMMFLGPLPKIRVEHSKLLGETGLGSFEALTGLKKQNHYLISIAPFVDVIAGCEVDSPMTYGR